MFSLFKLPLMAIDVGVIGGFIFNAVSLVVVVGSIVFIASLINKSIDKKQKAKELEDAQNKDKK